VVSSAAEEKVMRTIWIAATAAMLSLASIGPVSALVSNQTHVAAAKAALDDVVAVKRYYKHRPAGWSRGKAWWKRGGRGVPPGHWR
jgi:hypothetical protein